MNEFCLNFDTEYSFGRELFDYTVFRKKHPLMFSVTFLWKMLRFTQNFQGMFTRKHVFQKMKKIFFAISVVMLTSYFHICKLWVLPLKTNI